MSNIHRKTFSVILCTLLFLILLNGYSFAQYYPQGYENNNNVQSVVLDDFQFYTASQKQTQWCWASCITMVLNYYDIPCTQEEVVMRTYGTLVNYPARDMSQIARYLNGWGVTQEGKQVHVMAESYSYAPFSGIIEELQAGRPFIIGVGNGYSGHVVVCYGVDWINTASGPEVTNFYVYDPWPGNGQMSWSTEELNTYWVGAIAIYVQETGGYNY